MCKRYYGGQVSGRLVRFHPVLLLFILLFISSLLSTIFSFLLISFQPDNAMVTKELQLVCNVVRVVLLAWVHHIIYI